MADLSVLRLADKMAPLWVALSATKMVGNSAWPMAVQMDQSLVALMDAQ